MEPTRDLLRDLESALASQSMPKRGMNQLAERLAEGTRELEGKLARCEDLWAQGRFDEAREAAERGEALREAVGILEWPQREAWRTLCQRLELPTPSRLDAARARQVLGRFDSQPSHLESLVREYRRLSLGRAPLVDRLAFLRAIVSEAPPGSGWADDLRPFEQARHEELDAECAEAIAANDLPRLQALRQELEESEWRVPPPPALRTRLAGALAPLEADAQRSRQAELAQEIRAAHGALDEQRCRTLFAQWEGLGSGPDDPDVAAARSWLRGLVEERKQEGEFERACATLEEALDEPTTPQPEIERLASAVLRLERGMPDVLRARTTARLSALQSTGRRRFVLGLVGVLLAAGLLGGLIGLSWQHYERTTALEQWQERIEDALERKDYQAAEELVRTVAEGSPELYEEPVLQELGARVESAVEAEASRVEEFEAAIAAVSSAGVASSELPALLDKARALSRLETEVAQVAEWESRREVYLLDRERYRDEELEPEQVRLEELYERLRLACAQGEDHAEELGRECLELAARLSQAVDASEGFRQRAERVAVAAERLLEESRARSGRHEDVQESLETIRRSSSPGDLAQALRSFGRAFPDHPLAADFLQAAALEETWRALEAWQAATEGWDTIHVESDLIAAHRKGVVQEFLAEHPVSPQREHAEDVLAYLDAAEGALDDGLQGIAVARRVLETPLISEAHQVLGPQGRRYYLLDSDVDSQRGGEVFSFNYVVDVEGNTRHMMWRADDKGGPPVVRRAPQAALAGQLLRELREPERRWETLYLRMASAARAEEGLDPLLAALLTDLMLQLAQPVTPFVTPEIRDAVAALDTRTLSANWMNPDDGEAYADRPLAQRRLEQLPQLGPLVEKVESRLEQPPVRYRPVGVFLDEIVFQEPARQGALYVVTSGADPIVAVGRVVNGAVRLGPGASQVLTPGALVFLGNAEEAR